MNLALNDHLQASTWRRLWAISKTLDLKVGHKPAKEALVRAIAQFLQRRLARIVESLSNEERKALQALIAAGGRMPLAQFTGRFGPIRPYRPWRRDSPRHPWRKPISPAESLWYKGLIFQVTCKTPQGLEDLIVIPSDLLTLLPEAEKPPITPSLREVAPFSSHSAPDILQDAVLFLSLLHRTDISPLKGRWLPLRALRELNRRLSVSEDLRGVRSELKAGRLPFIHFLCEAGGFVALTGPFLKPTLKGWSWLGLGPEEQLKALWETWPGGMAHLQELWSRYRLPEAGPPLIGALLTHLKECPPGRWFTLSSFIEGILAIEEGLGGLTPWWERDEGVDRAVEGLSELLEGPLFWMGAVERGSNSEGESIFCLSPRGAWLLGLSEEAPPFPAFEPLVLRPDFTVEVPPHVCPISLVNLEACAEWMGKDPSGGRRYRLTAESVNRALERGMDIEEILDLLEREGQGRLSEAQVEALRRWAEEGQRLTVRRLTVLEAKEASLLEQLARRKRVREAFRRTLSPRAVALDEGRVKQVVRELRRLGFHPRVLLPPEERGRLRGRGGAAYLWVAARLYFGLGRLLPLPLRLPASLLDDLGAEMTPEEISFAEDVVEEILSRLGDLIDGRASYPRRPAGDVGSLLPIIERAIAEERPLEITYITAGRGERTHRVVEPYRIEWRRSVPYLIAYCHLREEERVFRVDRIEEARIYTT